MGNLPMYATKGFEYLLILGFLALFTVFYLYFTSRRFEHATVAVKRSIDGMVDWFRVPDNILFHQGHTWVRSAESGNSLTMIGMDDFAQKMAGPMELRNIPPVGASIRQGERGWSLQDGDKSVDMLSPLSGEVVEVNQNLLEELDSDTHKMTEFVSDPYGNGWLLKVRPDNFERDCKGLLSGSLARKWMEEVVSRLRSRMNPEIGAVLQDGGVPVAGMAKNIERENWDMLLKEFFLS